MARSKLSQLAVLTRKKRGTRKLRETSTAIGISPATLMRVEAGRIPDVATFGKICHWLEVDPGSFLGFRTGKTDSGQLTVQAHFRADKTPRQATVNALAQMILYVVRNQPSPSEPSGDA